MLVKLKNIILVVLIGSFLCGFSLWSILKPADTESISERRPLAAFPAVSWDFVLSGTFAQDIESYILDQFPLRDQFRTMKSWTALYLLGQKDMNNLYIKDGYVSSLEYPLNTKSLEHAAKRFQFVYAHYLTDQDIKVYLSVIPDKNYFMAQSNGYPAMDYEKGISYMKDHMKFAKYIDIVPLLELSDYYRTDAHWRQEKITDVAQYLAARMGVSLSAEYTENRVDAPFYGVYWGQSALPLPPDDLYYLDNAILEDCTVYDYETDAYIPIYDLEKVNGNDPYELFLSGSKSLLTIENPNAITDKELLVFRDSFGSSIAPMLAEGYAKVTLVDIRYLSPKLLDQFIEFSNQDVLFLYSVSVLNNSLTIK